MNPFTGAVPWAKVVQWAQSRETNAVSFDALSLFEQKMLALFPVAMQEWQSMNPTVAEPDIGDKNWVGLLQETISKSHREMPIFTETDQKLHHGRKNGEMLKWHVSLMLFDGHKFPCADYGYIDGKPYFFAKKKDAKQFACLNALRHIMDNNLLQLTGRSKENIYYASKALKPATSLPLSIVSAKPSDSLSSAPAPREDPPVLDSPSSSFPSTPAPVRSPKLRAAPAQVHQPPPPTVVHKRVMMRDSPETSPPPKKKPYEVQQQQLQLSNGNDSEGGAGVDLDSESNTPNHKPAARRKHPADKYEEDRDIEERKRRVSDLCVQLRMDMPRAIIRNCSKGMIEGTLVMPPGCGVRFEVNFKVIDKYDRKAAEQELWDIFEKEAERALQRFQMRS